MTFDLTVPELGESVAEATVARWLKTAGDAVARDEAVVELETDKANLEVTARAAGVLTEILVEAESDVAVGAVLGRIEEGAKAPAEEAGREENRPPPPQAPALSPAVRKLVADHALDPAALTGRGKGGRILKGDVLDALETPPPAPAPPVAPAPPAPPEVSPASPPAPPPEPAGGRRVPMTRLRRRIAERLKEAQNTAAMLTTWNEADMSAVVRARADYGKAFEAKYGVRLGFMSFFVKAVTTALQEQPEVGARIDGADVVYPDGVHIGVAVGAPRGLVVPVLRSAERMGFADIERAVADFARRARDAALTVADMTGGTFTVSNGGVYGSLLSAPILNPPQSAILGMHKIEKRPVVLEDDSIVARPMMYLALSYDHRLIDGREAVTFLVRVKECVEDPRRLALGV